MSGNYVRYIGSLWLFAMSSLSVVLVVYSLSAFQIQARIQAFSASGQSFSVWNIKRLSDRRRQRETLIQPASAQVAKLQKDLAEKQVALDEIRDSKRPLDDQVWRYERDIGTVLRTNGIAFEVDKESTFAETYSIIATHVATLNNKEVKVDQKTIDDYKKAVDESDSLYSKEKVLEAKIANIQISLEGAIKSLEQNEKAVESIFGPESQISKSDQSKIEDFLDELNVLQNKFGILGFMTEIPAELLTILLVICTGILVSSIYLTQAFFAETSRFGLGFYVFRPFSGALTALALFVVIKAGVIVAIDPFQLSKSGATLNPFFVSFIGIIGGLISEQVVERIKASSQSWLRTSALGRNRWAIGVKTEINKQKKSIADLSKFFDVDIQTLTEWIEEKRETPPEAQRIIAAWLELPERTLFTDLPPKPREEDIEDINGKSERNP